MIIYNNEQELITTTIGNINKNLRLASFYLDAESFKGRETRFFKIITEDIINRSIKCPTTELMAKRAKRKFYEITNVYNDLEYYDKEKSIGYKVFPYMKNPKVYSYKMIYPAITKFFQYWKEYSNTGESKKIFLPRYDLSSLFVSMENFKDLEIIFTKEQGELLKRDLYKEFPEFAIFYYEIYPYLNIDIIGCYDIVKLINARIQVYELGLDTKQLDAIIGNLDIAKNNGKILKLIKDKK